MKSDKPEENDVFLLQLAGDISDGRSVRWDTAEESATDADSLELLTQLKILSNIAAAHVGSEEATDTAAPHERWGHLEILECVGSGAFGQVYRARDLTLEREVALKLFRRGMGRDELDIIREARLLAKVNHPNVASVFGADNHDGRTGIWMEFIDGQNLEVRLEEQGRLGADEAMVIGRDLSRALAAVHGAGVLHRDVKTRNVMREEGGRIVLSDFGTGCTADDASASGRLCGTPLFMAPELLAGEEATVRSDIYSLGVVLFHLVTGRYPVEGKTTEAIREVHRQGRRTLLGDLRPDLPRFFVRAVEKAIAADPADRFSSAGQLEQALEPPPAKQPRLAWQLAAVAAAIAIAIVVWRGITQPEAFAVQAALYRVDDSTEEILLPGASITPGDRLYLEFESSKKVHVYVLSWDERGESYLLFPLSNSELRNPLPPRVKHRLPGTSRLGKQLVWTVTSSGGREHLIIVASREHLGALEAELAKVPAPSADQLAYVPVPESIIVDLRGIGGIDELDPSRPASTPADIVDKMKRIGSETESARKVWMRQVDLVYSTSN